MKTLSTITIAVLSAVTLTACLPEKKKDEYVTARQKVETRVEKRQQDLLGANGCRACHQDRRKLVGPSFAAISENMEKDGVDNSHSALQKYVKVIQQGRERTGGRNSGLRYGAIPKAPNPMISDTTAETLIFAIRRIGDEEGGR